MKYLKYFLLAGIVFITSSYTTRTSGLSEGIYPGNLMPELKLNDGSGKNFNLDKFKGVKVLLNFWAAYDAESHIQNVLLWNTLQKKNYPVVMLSVSFDKSISVFKKTLTLDGIDPDYQFCDIRGVDSEVYRDFQLEKGFKNYLIDENGLIMAMNLDPKDLEKELN